MRQGVVTWPSPQQSAAGRGCLAPLGASATEQARRGLLVVMLVLYVIAALLWLASR